MDECFFLYCQSQYFGDLNQLESKVRVMQTWSKLPAYGEYYGNIEHVHSLACCTNYAKRFFIARLQYRKLIISIVWSNALAQMPQIGKWCTLGGVLEHRIAHQHLPIWRLIICTENLSATVIKMYAGKPHALSWTKKFRWITSNGNTKIGHRCPPKMIIKNWRECIHANCSININFEELLDDWMNTFLINTFRFYAVHSVAGLRWARARFFSYV